MKKINKILIHAPNWLGDIMMSLPAMTLIREKYSDAHISIFLKSSMCSVFEESDIINETIPLSKIDTIKSKKFDMAILFPNSFISALRVFGKGIKYRVGYSGDYRNMMLTHIADRKPVRWINTTAYYVNMLKVIGIESEVPKVKLNIGSKALERASLYLENEDALSKPIFAYGVGATNSFGKVWHEKHFAEIMNTLSKKYDAKTLIISTPEESEMVKNVVSLLDHKPLIPHRDLATISAMLSLCKGFIGNDSGAMHLSSAIGIPTLGLYFATPPYQNMPIGERSDIIVKQLPCAFCGGQKCKLGTFECREVIKPNEVLAKFENMIEKVSSKN